MADTVDLRCEHELHGRLTDNRWLEVKCRRRACGFVKGHVLLHTIDLQTGEVVATRQFRDPKNLVKKERGNASHHPPAAVRHP